MILSYFAKKVAPRQLIKLGLFLFFALIISLILFSYYRNNPQKNVLTPLVKPTQIYTLPNSLNLHEISGISPYNKNIIASEQDNLGDIFFYDLGKQEVVNRINIAPPGDFEDISIVGDNAYLLRSDGILYESENYLSSKPAITKYQLDLRAVDNEGLAYDSQSNSLLISTKSDVQNVGTELKSSADDRWIYSFDLTTKKLNKDPFVILSLKSVQQFIQESGINTIPKKKFGGGIEFRPSGLAVEPRSGNLYIISSVDNLLVVSSRKGSILFVRQLDLDDFNKPEGITFLNDGNMLISNEGGNGLATIMKLQNPYEK